jgi:hypothetical protein
MGLEVVWCKSGSVVGLVELSIVLVHNMHF